jgi:hypothetical protein
VRFFIFDDRTRRLYYYTYIAVKAQRRKNINLQGGVAGKNGRCKTDNEGFHSFVQQIDAGFSALTIPSVLKPLWK